MCSAVLMVDSGINMRQTQPFRFIDKFSSWSPRCLKSVT